jgi:hypothetical protein
MMMTLPSCPQPTTGSRRGAACVLALALLALAACGGSRPRDAAQEPEPESRTEFTARMENFFEYDPIKPDKPSRFLIHLTDLTDGSPVEKAEVTLTVRATGKSGPAVQTKAKVGRVTGIYVAEVGVPAPGSYDIEFHVKNAKLDERMPLTGFKTP